MAYYRSRRTKTTVGRKRGKLQSSADRLSIDRIVYLPYDMATIYSAAQNFRIDLAKGIHYHPDVWGEVKSSYMEEALENMQDDGCNHYPGDNDEPWIHAATAGEIAEPSRRANELLYIFDYLFTRIEQDKLRAQFTPHPAKVQTHQHIEQHLNLLRKRFVFH